MDWDTLYLMDLEPYEREVEILNKSIAIHRNAKIKTEYNQNMLRIKSVTRNRIMGSVPVYGAYCHIKSKTTIIKN
jgi:hypothetical protein